jgi:hypothetical protein
VGEYTEAFVGIDVAKMRNKIAIADGTRGDEVHISARSTLLQTTRGQTDCKRASTVASTSATKRGRPGAGFAA